MAKNIEIGGRLHSVATEHIVAGANEIQDDTLNKTQAKINEEVNSTLETHGSAIEGLNSQNYKSYTATNATMAVTDVLPDLGAVNTIYRLGNWDGEQYDTTQYAEYAWINTGIDQGNYVLLDVKNYGIDNKPTAGSDNLVKSGGVAEKIKNIEEQKLDKEIDDNSFYITDSNGNTILKIDSNGVHSVDYTYKNLEDSLADELGNVSIIAKFASILQSIVNESTQRQNADNAQIGLIGEKLDKVIDSNKFFVTDSQGYKIFQIDAEGIHATNIVLHNNNLKITDANGYIVLSIGSDGIIHTTKDKHAVACMVLSESYYPTETPVRDSDGNIISANVMFETGVKGSLSITYTNGNATSVAVVYGNYNYTISINRDNNGNVDSVSVN